MNEAVISTCHKGTLSNVMLGFRGFKTETNPILPIIDLNGVLTKRSNPSHRSSAKVHSSAFSSVVFFLVGGCDVFFSKYQTIQSKKIHTFNLSSWWFVNLFLVGGLNHP